MQVILLVSNSWYSIEVRELLKTRHARSVAVHRISSDLRQQVLLDPF